MRTTHQRRKRLPIYYQLAGLYFIFIFCFSQIFAQQSVHSFKIIPLGVRGGSDESNLSSYMVAPAGEENYICLDAGSLHAGIQKAIDNRIFKGEAARILRSEIRGYLISHPHLDHVAGLILNSPDDTSKIIYGLPFCLEVLKNNYFTWKNWANFTNEGEKPTLNKYQYIALDTGRETEIQHTEMSVHPFLLSHSSPFKSTAFLIRHASSFLLYLGDTGADSVEHSNCLFQLWQAIAPLIQSKKLKAVFIETSFPDEQPMKQLFGHLTPKLLMTEMAVLAKLTGAAAIKDFPVVVTHMKPSSKNAETRIKSELIANNPLHLHFIFPRQGIMIKL